MGNSHNKSTLRKAQSVPDTQALPPDAPVLLKERSQSQQRLNQPNGKPGKLYKLSKKHKQQQQDLPQLPPAEAAFLPDFPLRGDIQDLEFEVIDVIAQGAYGNVIKVQREDQKRFYAVKVLDKGQIIQEGAIRQCKDEAAIQSMAGSHPLVVKAHEYWQSRRNLYIVLDYVPHGDMFTLWTFHGAFPEQLVKLYIAEMALVIDYLHNSSVIYRDVKMENILFNAKGHIQLTDFGLAKWLPGGEQTRTVCGTLQYMAPEVLSVYPYSHSADWWSVGILMYAMLAGRYPVDGADTHTRMAQKVFECDYFLPSEISDAAQDVINRILTKSPHKRLCDLDILQDLHFFEDVFFGDLVEQKLNPLEVVPEDFFPMTGESWAPHLLTPEEQHHFSQFDDSRDTITNEPHYPHLPHYRYQQKQHHPDPYPRLPPAKQQAQPQRPGDMRQPYSRQQSHHSDQQHKQSQYNQYSDRRPSGQSDHSQQNFVSSYNNPPSSHNSSQFPGNSSATAMTDRGFVQPSMPATAGTSRGPGSAAPTAYSGGSNMLHQNTKDQDDMARGGNMGGYGTNRSNGSVDRRNSGGGAAPVGTVYPVSSGHSFTNGNSQPNLNSGYKSVESPPTLTLKSLALGTNQSQSHYNQSRPVYSSQSSVGSTVSPGYSSQPHTDTYPHTASQRPPSQGPPSAVGPSPMANSQHFDHGYTILEGPPTITLPSIQTNFSQSANRNFQQSQPIPGTNNSYNPSKPTAAGYTRRLEEATVRLDSAPQLQAPTAQTLQPRVPQERPVVPVKPIPPQKPTVAAKPSAPVRPTPAAARPTPAPARPTPAPRKSLKGHNRNSDLSQAPATGSAFYKNPGEPSSLYSTISRVQDPSAVVNTAMTINLSYNSEEQRNVTHLSTQHFGSTENMRPRLGSNNNILTGTAHMVPASPTSPTVENANLKWNLPAGAMPSYV